MNSSVQNASMSTMLLLLTKLNSVDSLFTKVNEKIGFHVIFVLFRIQKWIESDRQYINTISTITKKKKNIFAACVNKAYDKSGP